MAMGRGTALLRRSGLLLRCALGGLPWLAIAAPTAAQESAAMDARVAIVQPLSLANTEDLDFGQIAVTAAGTVVLTPDAAPTCAVTGGTIHYGTCTAAVFEGYGQSGRTVRVKVPNRIDLTGPAGATMRVNPVTISANPTLGPPLTGGATSGGFRRYRIVSVDGSIEFRIGGTLNVAANQPFGLYTATFEVDIAYE